MTLTQENITDLSLQKVSFDIKPFEELPKNSTINSKISFQVGKIENDDTHVVVFIDVKFSSGENNDLELLKVGIRGIVEVGEIDETLRDELEKEVLPVIYGKLRSYIGILFDYANIDESNNISEYHLL